ncbi:helix-turn-helix domain-containing protein [Bdellovibrio svalbardensis]|uniref:Helix-turn-helix domain-containing protein n=1 Tax=Bdellovibrio svalbardensis TaxID=2972972 RepID=A0ABT6DDU5_9BACT|nr:helix-turn-helix domain-containing protein [Bdellovibrio svalbardensis]MDG0815010.1 helix-turn-helix domain-containing protein [Bdellovibrio svalbardensis]
MKKTGEILKKAREEKGLSLNEVGLSLKISSKVLKAIEEGDEKNLPAKTFLRGFVKSYASYLRLDADKVLETFYEEFGSTRPQPYIRPTNEPVKEAPVETTEKTAAPVEEKTESKPEQKPEEKPAPAATVTPIRHVQATPSAPISKAQPYSPLQEKKNTKTIVICVVGALLIGLIFFTKKMIDKYTKEAEVPVAQVEQTMEGATPVASVAPVESMTPEPTPQPSPLSDLTKKPTATVPATMVTPTPAATPPATAKVTPGATPAASATPAPSVTPAPTAATAAVSPAASPSPTPTPKPEEKNKPVELIVEALDSVEIEYAAPNGKPQKIKLSAEQVHTFKSRSGLKISFSNGGAVNLILNGKEVGIPGDLGKPIKLSY